MSQVRRIRGSASPIRRHGTHPIDPAAAPIKLRPELVPETAWGSNLRSVLPQAEWDRLRKETYRKAGYRCEVCGGKGPKWTVECHEVWEYNERTGVQRLVRLIALCPDCHEAKHYGLAKLNGRHIQAQQHLMRVNGISCDDVGKMLGEVFDEWKRRSKLDWKLDLSAIGVGKNG